jgi:hypothetical protein
MAGATHYRRWIHRVGPAAVGGWALLGLLGCSEPPVMLGPFYHPEQGIGAAELVGTWRVPGEGEATKVIVSGEDPRVLTVQWHRPEGDWWAEGVVIMFRGRRYLDLGATRDQEEWPSGPSLTTHFAFLLDLKADTLSLWYVDQDGWANALERFGLPRLYHLRGPRPGESAYSPAGTLVLAYPADSLQRLMDSVMRTESFWRGLRLIRAGEAERFVADRGAR